MPGFQADKHVERSDRPTEVEAGRNHPRCGEALGQQGHVGQVTSFPRPPQSSGLGVDRGGTEGHSEDGAAAFMQGGGGGRKQPDLRGWIRAFDDVSEPLAVSGRDRVAVPDDGRADNLVEEADLVANCKYTVFSATPARSAMARIEVAE